MTLRLRSGAKLNQPLLQSLLDSAIDFIASQAHAYGGDAECNDMPFQYDIGEGIEISIWFILHPFTWRQLATLLRGLEMWILDGKRFREWKFEVGELDSVDGYPWLGWGDVGMVKRAEG